MMAVTLPDVIYDPYWAQVRREVQAVADAQKAKRATRRKPERCIFDHVPTKGRSHPHWLSK